MSSLNVASMKTFGKKLSTFIGLGLTGLIIYYGIAKIDEANTNSEFKDRVEYVQELAEKHQFEPAEKLFKEYTEQKLLRPEDKIKIETTIKNEKEEYKKKQSDNIWKWNKNKKTAEFESKLEESLKDAEDKLEELKATGMFSNEDITSLKDRIYSHTEEGLRLAWQKNENTEKTCAEYLQNYPKGAYRKEAIKNLLRAEISTLANDLENSGHPTYTKIKLDNLNSNLKKYASEGISLTEATDKEEIFYKAVSYAHNAYQKDNSSWLFIGDKVRFTWSSDKWESEYSNIGYDKERNSIISVGTEGTLIAYSNEKEYVIKFESVKRTWWKHSWDLDKYWTQNRRNVAKFKASELTKIPRMNKYDKEDLLKQADELRANLEVYMPR